MARYQGICRISFHSAEVPLKACRILCSVLLALHGSMFEMDAISRPHGVSHNRDKWFGFKYSFRWSTIYIWYSLILIHSRISLLKICCFAVHIVQYYWICRPLPSRTFFYPWQEQKKTNYKVLNMVARKVFPKIVSHLHRESTEKRPIDCV